MMKHLFMKTLAMIAGIFCFVAGAAHAEVVIDITKGNVAPLPIAVTNLQSGNDLGAQITQYNLQLHLPS